MNCTKCRHPLDARLKCWSCGTQHCLTVINRTDTVKFINHPIDSSPGAADYYYPEDEYIQLDLTKYKIL